MSRPLRYRRFAPALAAALATALALTAIAWAHTGSQPMRPMKAANGKLVRQIAAVRLATAKYATGLGRAKADGYQIITRMIPNMGWHFMNPNVKGFDVRRPPILVYEKHGSRWQLGALEWVFPKKPAKPPLPGARYGSFAAACHYKDGTFVAAGDQSQCAPRSPKSGAAFTFWHPDLVTLHVWAWYPNPAGMFEDLNPLLTPFN